MSSLPEPHSSVGAVQLSDIPGHWFAVGVTRGAVDLPTFVTSAQIVIDEPVDDRCRALMVLTCGKRSFFFDGAIAPEEASASVYRWKGRIGWLVAPRRNWTLTKSKDSSVVVISQPPRLAQNAASAVFARAGVPLPDVKRILDAESATLGLLLRDVAQLVWHLQPTADDISGATARWQDRENQPRRTR